MRILLVDDHEVVCDGMALLLKKINPTFVVFSVRNYGECLAWLALESCDLILFDLGLPDCNGIDALTELKTSYAAIPIVVLSGDDHPDTVLAALHRGAMGFIPKSSNVALMTSALELIAKGGVYIPSAVLHALPSANPDYGRSDRRENRMLPVQQTMSALELGLTDRQFDVLKLLIKGLPNKLIARQLDLSEQTIKAHVGAILRALNVSSRTQAVLLCAEKQLALGAL